MTDIAEILKRMDTYRRCLPISGQACLDELSDAIHDLKVENDNAYAELENEAQRDYQALEAELGKARSQLVNDQWRPIETSPKDESKILVFGKKWDGDYIEVTSFYRGRWTVEWMDGHKPPTHWRPMPAAPSLPDDQGTTK